VNSVPPKRMVSGTISMPWAGDGTGKITGAVGDDAYCHGEVRLVLTPSSTASTVGVASASSLFDGARHWPT
jgi:hypothetical protein